MENEIKNNVEKEEVRVEGKAVGVEQPIIDVEAETVESSVVQDKVEQPRSTMTIALVFNLIAIVLLILLGLTFILGGSVLAGFLSSSMNTGWIVGLAGGMGFLVLLPLAWCIPMTVRLARVRKACNKPSVALGVCTLLFVNLISGILILCSRD